MTINKIIYKFIASIIVLMVFTSTTYAANYYWIGGAGNWSDLNHWSTSSGGSAHPAAVPGNTDHVFFDANSGFGSTNALKTVTVNVTAICANFTVSGVTNAPIIAGTNTLNVYGNMLLQTGTVWNAAVSFKPAASQTLNTNTVALNNNVSIDGPGTLTLLGDTKINNAFQLSFVNGTFDTDGKRLDVGGLRSTGSAAKTLRLGASQVYIAIGAMFHTGAINIQAGTSHLHFTSTMNVNAANNSSIQGLSASGATTLYDVTFEEPNTTLSGINPNTSAAGAFTFRNLTFKGNATMQKNSHTVANLFLATGKGLSLPISATLTITQSLNLGTSADVCAAYNSFSSTLTGTVANVKMMAGATANVNHSVIRDIKIARDLNPSETFNAQLNSYNLGGNSGWNFVAATPLTFYWIGGTGDWSDPNHWATTSGGVAGICLPSLSDDVVFDNNSGFTAAGQVVNIDSTGRCHNISFLATGNAPTVSSTTGSSISPTGSAIWQSGMTLSTGVAYTPRGLQTVTSNGVKHTSVSINGWTMATDKLTLLDAFESTGNVVFKGGTFNTNNQVVTLANFFGGATNVGSDLVRRLELTSSHIYVKNSFFDTYDNAISIASGTSVIHFTAVLGNNEGLMAFGTHQYYDVIFENPGSTNITAGIPTANGTAFHNVTFMGNASIRYSGKFNSLTLSMGKAYDLRGTLTITGSLNAVSTDCTKPITLTSGTSNIISMPATATVNVQGVIISNSNTTGGANFSITNSTDVENNSGWIFTSSSSRNLYWVGGSGSWTNNAHWSLVSGGVGDQCMPTNSDDVFFDANSGFTAASKIVSFPTSDTYVHNFTVNGTTTPPTFSGTTSLNVYGSMALQNGIAYQIITYFKPSAGDIETLTTNGAHLGNSNKTIFVNGSGTLKLMDNAVFDYDINLLRGTFDTNDKTLQVRRIFDWYSYTSSPTIRTLKLGSSKVTITGANSYWDLMMIVPGSAVNAGTSQIYFTGLYDTGTGSITLRPNMQLYDVYFTNASSTSAGLSYGYGNNASSYPGGDNLKFNSLTFKGGGYINSTGNTFGTLVLSAGKTYQFKGNAEQIITDKLYASGNPCNTLTLKSITSGSQTKLKVLGGSTNYDYALLSDINATGNALNYAVNSSNAGNNANIVFDNTGTPGVITGFGADWLCHVIETGVPASYTLTSDGFYADPATIYSWTKVGDPAFPGVLGVGATLDISTTGYGTYKLAVTYGDNCSVNDQIVVQKGTAKPLAPANQKICATVYTSLANLTITGTAIKWYADAVSTTVLPGTTLLISDHTYYATQTVNNGCESARIPVTVKLENCAIANPAIRSKALN